MLQASSGSHTCGTVESMKADTGLGRSAWEEPAIVIDWIPTTRSRESSPAWLNEMLLGTKREESYPPRVRLAVLDRARIDPDPAM
ncbi:MAG: hypothetical protein Q9226_002377 [Calogaya cf. arnoldii]